MLKADVVVIDDDDGVRWVLEELLAAQNISCRLARSGQEGIKVVSESRPALAIVDIKLGSMNGLDVARRICNDHKDVKILFITGYSESIKEKLDDDLPVIGIIEKPFDLMELLARIRDVLSSYPRAAEAPVQYA